MEHPGYAVSGCLDNAVSRRGKQAVAISHNYIQAVPIGDARQRGLRSRLALGPIESVSGGQNRAKLTHRHKLAVAKADAAKTARHSWLAQGPARTEGGAQDRPAASHRDKLAVPI